MMDTSLHMIQKRGIALPILEGMAREHRLIAVEASDIEALEKT